MQLLLITTNVNVIVLNKNTCILLSVCLTDFTSVYFFIILYRFVFMALMEYCVVNVVLGDYEFSRVVKKTRMEAVNHLASRMVNRAAHHEETSLSVRTSSFFILPAKLLYAVKSIMHLFVDNNK